MAAYVSSRRFVARVVPLEGDVDDGADAVRRGRLVDDFAEG